MKSIRISLQTLAALVLVFSLIIPAWVAQAEPAPADTWDDPSVTYTALDSADEPCGTCSGTASHAGQDADGTASLSEGDWMAGPLKVNVQIDLAQAGDAVYIYELLDPIEKRDWRTTVFVSGEIATSHPEVVGAIQDRGHEIGVHGWQSGENLALLSYEEQLELVQRAFSAVRGAVNRPEEVVDFKPHGYASNVDTFEALLGFGARSTSGIFSIDDHESFSWCPYVQISGKVTFPYPITDTFWAIPISTTEIDFQETPLDDEYIDDPEAILASMIAGYDQQAETRDPLTIVLRPSITGADEAKLDNFSQFLDHVQSNDGNVKPLSSMTHLTQFIPSLEITSAPASAVPGETITITTQFRAAIYCPRYYFHVYGRYPEEAQWTLLAEHYHGLRTGTFSFSRSFDIPQPSAVAVTTGGGVATATAVSDHVDCLKNEGVQFVGRYFAVENTWKAITEGEARMISDAGMAIVSIWQEAANYPEYFTYDRGRGHGRDAFEYAVEIGQTPNTPVYFAVDADILSTDRQRILDYFEGVHDGYEEYLQEYDTPYKIGVYGSYWVLNWLQEQGIATYFYQAYSPGWSGGENSSPWPDYNIRQTSSNRDHACGVLIDDLAAASDFGGWRYGEGEYTVRVVGQACSGTCWPTPDTYEKMDEVEIAIEVISRVLPAQAAALARGVIGAPYLWGGKGYDFRERAFVDIPEIITEGYNYYNPNTGRVDHAEGLDCAGLSMWTYNRAYYGDEVVNWARCAGYCDGCDPECPVGYEGAHGQYHHNTEAITRDKLLPGDLLFFDAYSDSATGQYSTPGQDGHIDHVAMYVGPFVYEGEEYDVVEATPPEIIATTVDDIIARIRGFAGEGAFDDQDGFRRVVHSAVEMAIIGNSPIDVVVVDPDGLVSGKDNPKGPFEYQVRDMSGDGEMSVVLLTGERKTGTYQIEVVPHPDASPTDTYGLAVVVDGITTTLAENVPIGEIPQEPYIYESQPPTAIQGTVIDYNGQPVANARVQLIGPSVVSTHTDEDGYYRLVRLEPGSHAIDVTPDAYGNLMSARVTVSISAGATVTRDFVLNTAGSIAGTVTDAEGNPVVGVRLYLSGYETPRYATNGAGEFVIPGLPAGTRTVNIHAPGYDPWHILVDDTYIGRGTSVTVATILGQTTWVDFTQQLAEPEIRISPELLDFRLPVGGTTTGTLTVHNAGNAPLDFAFGLDDVHWLCLDPGEGTIEPGDQTMVTVTANTAGLEAGQYAGSIIITSNDVDRGVLYVPVSLTVYLEAIMTVDPDTLNLQAPGRWITAYIELPEEYAVEDIDIDTVQLICDGNVLDADWGDVQDGVLIVKFDWATVAGWFDGLHDVDVELTVAGEVYGVDFEGTDTICIIDPPRRRGRG